MYKRIFLFLFSSITVIFYSFFGIWALVGFLLQIILIASLVSLFIFFFKKSIPYLNILRDMVIRVLAFVGVILVCLAGFISYHNLNPATLSNITLTNGSGKIVFLEMSHIATNDFYQYQHNRIRELAGSGYTILVEGVRPGTPENQELFDRMIGVQFTENLYESLGKLAGLAVQNDAVLFAGINTGSLKNVDIGIDDIITLIGTGEQMTSGEVPDLGTELQGTLDRMPLQEQRITSWVLRAFLNLSLKQSPDIEMQALSGDQAALFRTILHRRNDPLLSYIETHPNDRIAIVYGALHFNELYERLQRLAPPWNIIHIESTYPYR